MNATNKSLLSITLIIVLLISLALASSTTYAKGGSENGEGSTELDIGSVPVTFVVGQRIDLLRYGATRTQSGCNIPAIIMKGGLRGSIAERTIVASINGNDCSMTIESINTVSENGGDSQASSDKQYKSGWAQSRLLDPIALPLTLVYAAMYYQIRDGEVGWGSQPRNWCRTLYFAWVIDECDPSWNPDGPSLVSIKTEGEFHHTILDDSVHTMLAEFYASPTWADYWCKHTGHVAGPVKWECKGKRETS